jgi:hypothetical protein
MHRINSVSSRRLTIFGALRQAWGALHFSWARCSSTLRLLHLSLRPLCLVLCELLALSCLGTSHSLCVSRRTLTSFLPSSASRASCSQYKYHLHYPLRPTSSHLTRALCKIYLVRRYGTATAVLVMSLTHFSEPPCQPQRSLSLSLILLCRPGWSASQEASRTSLQSAIPRAMADC